MSQCKLKKDNEVRYDPQAYRVELQLVLCDFTAGFVSQKQYQQLMYVLGQNVHTGPIQSCKDVLTLFNDFPTNTMHNFKDMLHRLQFPYIYDEDKTLAQNRRDFQDFFSCLSNIRCAVVEGGHRCDAASRTLQGYKMCDPLPLKYNKISVPESSTLFRPVQTRVYYCQKKDSRLDETILKDL